MVERISYSVFGITYKAALVCFRAEFVRRYTFYKSITTPNFQDDILGFLPFQILYGVISTDFDGALFKVKAVISNA